MSARTVSRCRPRQIHRAVTDGQVRVAGTRAVSIDQDGPLAGQGRTVLNGNRSVTTGIVHPNGLVDCSTIENDIAVVNRQSVAGGVGAVDDKPKVASDIHRQILERRARSLYRDRVARIVCGRHSEREAWIRAGSRHGNGTRANRTNRVPVCRRACQRVVSRCDDVERRATDIADIDRATAIPRTGVGVTVQRQRCRRAVVRHRTITEHIRRIGGSDLRPAYPDLIRG